MLPLFYVSKTIMISLFAENSYDLRRSAGNQRILICILVGSSETIRDVTFNLEVYSSIIP